MSTQSEQMSLAAGPDAVIVQQGRLLDYIDQVTQRNETPEEYVRQEIAKSLVREYGYPKCDFEVEYTIRVGSRKPRVDLAIFSAGADHKIENAHILVECKSTKVKANDRKDGVGQLQSYMSSCPNVHLGMWTNGIERYCYRKIHRDGRIYFEEIADLPEFGKDSDTSDQPTFDSLRPATSDALLFAFRRCHNYIAGNQGLAKPQAFWELLKLIFCKIHDERASDEVQFYSTAKERHGVNGPAKAARRIERLFSDVKKDFPRIFDTDENIKLDPRVLSYLVSQLQSYSLLDSDIDVKGRAYEEIVGSNLRGDRGEFFTPRPVCRMAVEMLNPTEKDLIADPACGTGGFLITAMNHVIDDIHNAEFKKWAGNVQRAEAASRDRVARFAEKHMVGLDFNPELVKASKMNMVLNNDGSGGIYQANSLDNPMTWDDSIRERELLGSVDILFTNPPFGSKIPISDRSILEQYELGYNWYYDDKSDKWVRTGSLQSSQPPEILFIERCVQLLKPGTGRMAVVLPDGILGSPGLGYVREWILTNCQILASIDMHPDTFQPFVSIQTSVLVLRRKSGNELLAESAAGKVSDYNVFMALANHIGHDKRGNVIYVRDAHGNEIVQETTKKIKEYEDGVPVYREQRSSEKVVDDNTLQIAERFREWITEQA